MTPCPLDAPKLDRKSYKKTPVKFLIERKNFW